MPRRVRKYGRIDLTDGTWNSPYYVDGKVYMGVPGGAAPLWLCFNRAKFSKPPTKIDMEYPMRVPPVAANGVLFIHNATYLYAIAEKK